MGKNTIVLPVALATMQWNEIMMISKAFMILAKNVHIKN
jgi:hypothetical protein